MRENVFLVHHTPQTVIELSHHIRFWFLLPKHGFIFYFFLGTCLNESVNENEGMNLLVPLLRTDMPEQWCKSALCDV